MKPITEPMPAQNYYYIKHRSHAARFLLGLIILSNALIWAVVASLYSSPSVVIWLCVLAIFALFVCVVEHRACELYHTRYLRALCDGSILNTNTTEQ